jgi:hypothetical protein
VSVEAKKEIELEIAHVLFLDIVGYSKLSMNEQHARIQELNEIVRESEQFRKAEASAFRLPHSAFFLPTSYFILHTSYFILQTSDFRLPLSRAGRLRVSM